MKDDYCPNLSDSTQDPLEKGFSCRTTVVWLYRNVVIMKTTVIHSIRHVTWLSLHPDVELAIFRARGRFEDPHHLLEGKLNKRRQQTYKHTDFVLTVHS
jgi:hypothetical protein